MGVIIHLHDNVNHYASINTNTVSVSKNISYAPVNEPVEGATLVLGTEQEISFIISGEMDIWDNETASNENDRGDPIQRTTIFVKSNTIPENLYTEVYTKFKSGLASYTDDI